MNVAVTVTKNKLTGRLLLLSEGEVLAPGGWGGGAKLGKFATVVSDQDLIDGFGKFCVTSTQNLKIGTLSIIRAEVGRSSDALSTSLMLPHPPAPAQGTLGHL